MTTGILRTQGSELFVADTIRASTPTRRKFVCPTGVTGLGGTRDQIDSSCLDTEGDREFEGGLSTPSPISVPFNFIPTEESHEFLFDWHEDGRVMNWILCFSDGDDVPALVGGEFTPPTDRSSIKFAGYVADVNIDVATNEIVRGTLTIQRSGRRQLTPKAA